MFLIYDGTKQVMEKKITLIDIHKNAKKIVFYT